jgi:hypothetical protein
MTSGPIDLERLIDAQELLSGGSQPWIFLAFSRNILNHEGVPEDLEAQEYIAAVQCEGVPVGIWIDTPTAGVTKRKPHPLLAVGHPTTSSPTRTEPTSDYSTDRGCLIAHLSAAELVEYRHH